MLAAGRLIVDTDLPKADPAREPFEEAVALRHLAQRKRGARREQPEIARVLRDFVTRAPIAQRVERPAAKPAQRRLVPTMRLGGVDPAVAAIEPVRDQPLD